MSKIQKLLKNMNENDESSQKELKFFNLINDVFKVNLLKDDKVSPELFNKYNARVDNTEGAYGITFTVSDKNTFFNKSKLKQLPEFDSLFFFSTDGGIKVSVSMNK